jgi:hypothetical protein
MILVVGLRLRRLRPLMVGTDDIVPGSLFGEVLRIYYMVGRVVRILILEG